MSSRVYSDYFQQLKGAAKKRYAEKLDMLGTLSDPYADVNTNPWSLDSASWPEVEYLDMYNYLISTPSPYTKKEMKAYKSLEGYKYFVDGWVGNVLVQHDTASALSEALGVAVVIVSVRHS